MEIADVKAKKTRNRKTYTGVVVSDKMEKTVVVKVTTKTLHVLYKKYVTRSKKVKVHDPESDAHLGDTVKVEECRPVSKDKTWRLVQIVERAK